MGELYHKAAMYQTLRSVSDNHVFAVCRDGTFYDR
jgi:hypothetical protein